MRCCAWQERLKLSLPPGKARKDVSPADFCDGGGLEQHGMQVQLWASYRAQHLARTVRGAVPAHLLGP